MDGHSGGGRHKRLIGRHRPNGVPAPQYQRHRGLGHAGNQLRNPKARFYVAPYRVQQHQKPVDLVALLHRGQQGHYMLVLGAFAGGGQDLVALDLSHDGQDMDGPPLCLNDRRTQLVNSLELGLFLIFVHKHSSLRTHSLVQWRGF